jgi:hypothetical protein
MEAKFRHQRGLNRFGAQSGGYENCQNSRRIPHVPGNNQKFLANCWVILSQSLDPCGNAVKLFNFVKDCLEGHGSLSLR